ncbi:MAG: diguanylate cyclase, partial [Clostridium sp.]
MFDKKYSKELQINVIVSIVKLASLLFTVMICLKLFVKGSGFGDVEFVVNNQLMYVLIPLIGFVFVFSIWTFSNKKEMFIRRNRKIINIENLLFTAIFTTIILLSDGHESQYKFIFLFIIITATIELGMKSGLSIASVSSLILITIDLTANIDSKVNPYFENDLILSGVFILTA